jgi:hypothetical protein
MQQERASERTIRGCLAIRGYASAAGVTLIRQSSHSALHCFVEEVSPVFHHRLKFKMVWHRARLIVPLKIGKDGISPEHHRGKDEAGGIDNYGVSRLRVEVTAVFTTQR